MPTYRLLADFTVLDLSRNLPGQFCTWLLAGLGAHILTIAEPGDQDATTDRDVPGARDRILGRNKRRLTLNLKRAEGQQIFFRLLERADVVVEGFRPGVAARLGVDYRAASAARPEVVYCSISSFGQDGPYRERPAHDINFLALTGLLDLTGRPDSEPVIPATQVADLAAGSSATVAILAALLQRHASGRGQYVDLAMLDATFCWMVIPLIAELTGTPPSRGSWLLGGAGRRYRIYRCKDGKYLSVGSLESRLWRGLLDALGLADPSAEELEAVFATRTRDEWSAILSVVNTCVAPVNTLAEALDDPQLRHR